MINFGAILVNFKGEQLRDSAAPDAKKLTLGSVAVNALLTDYDFDRQLQPVQLGKERHRRYKLARRIDDSTAGDAELGLSVEDVALIKQLIGLAYSPLIVGQCFELLDPDAANVT